MKHKKNFSLPAPLSSSSLSSPPPTSSPEVRGDQKSYPNARSAITKSGSLVPRGRDYVELLARSNFSFLMGGSHPDEMVLRAKQLGYRGLALCDVNGLYGVVRGFQAAEKPSHFDATQIAAHTSYSEGRFRYHLGAELTPFDASAVALLPTSKDGYTRLSRLITHVKRPAAKGRLKLSLEDILEEAGVATGELLAMPLPPWNMKDLEKMVDAFGDRLYLPVHKDSTWESIELARQAIQIERRLGPSGLKLFATQRPLFHTPERKPLHDVLTCLHHGVTLNEAKTKLTLNSERYLRPLDELRLIYRDRPDLLHRTMEISDRLQFSLSELRYKYPQEALPMGKTSFEHLRELVEKGLAWRYPEEPNSASSAQTHPHPPATKEIREKARKQAEHELTLIRDLEYEDYFLTLHDICQFAHARGILHQGRGSAANSIVCYTIGLTAIDPIRLGLLFERFISRERAEPPDIDIDFEHERREEVIQYIYRKYGASHAAMVSTTICFRSRMALREVSKVMGVPLEKIDLLVKTMGREGLSQLLATPFDIAKFGMSEEKFRLILKLANEIKGFPRHLGIHSGGFVIAHEPVVDLVPVEAATMTDRYVIQWNKDDVATLGLMKIDILSLGMLSAIRKSLELLKSAKGISYELATVPQEDAATYAMIQKADTIGVFQIESRAQMSLLPRLKPKTWYDLVVQVAIVRPGPIQGGMVHPYLRRRAGQDKVTYAHPRLEPILAKTMGVPIFQEQVMQIVVAVAGFTPGEADELRRVVSSAWRKKAVMHGLRQRLVNGMLNNGIGVEYADQIYKVIEGFAEYGFPESHAASFALLTYISCWMKCHHPDVFAISILNSQPMGFYPPRQLISDAQRHGVQFQPLDVQASDWDYTLAENGVVRVGLRSVDGLSENEARILIASRSTGRFRDLEDLIRRTQISKKSLTRLATAGALQSVLPPGVDTRKALFALQGLNFDQQSFFYGTEPLAHNGVATPMVHNGVWPVASNEAGTPMAQPMTGDGRETIRNETAWESVAREFKTKGFSLDSHPMKVLREQPGLMTKHQSAENLKNLPNGAVVKMAGLRSLLQKPPTAKGVCFVSLEDETGIFNIIIMPDVYEKVRTVLYLSNILEVVGRLQNQKGVIHVKAADLRPFQLPSRLLRPPTSHTT
jgi:DNA-directed DNA polymerase III PolC